jgi:hypothetical protein
MVLVVELVEKMHLASTADPENGRTTRSGEEFAMTQLYLQRFEYRAAAKSEFDQAWGTPSKRLPGAVIGAGPSRAYGTSRPTGPVGAAMC